MRQSRSRLLYSLQLCIHGSTGVYCWFKKRSGRGNSGPSSSYTASTFATQFGFFPIDENLLSPGTPVYFFVPFPGVSSFAA